MRSTSLIHVAYLLLVYCSGMALAEEPSPFGMTIGSSTLQEIQSKHTLLDDGLNRYTEGPMYHLNVEELNFDGLQKGKVIFNQGHTLAAVLLTFDKSRYKDLKAICVKNYQQVSEQEPFVGNRIAVFTKDNTHIELVAEHMSSEANLRFVHKALMDAYERQAAAEAEQKKQAEEKALLGGSR